MCPAKTFILPGDGQVEAAINVQLMIVRNESYLMEKFKQLLGGFSYFF